MFVSLAPLLAPVTLPPDFLALSKWVIVAGEQKIPRTLCRRYGCGLGACHSRSMHSGQHPFLHETNGEG